jgi:8-amino-7-oxononanoate synthase
VNLDQRLADELELRRQQHLYRTRRILQSPQGAEVVIGGRHCVSFCSNDYLGLANHPLVIKALQEGAAHYGVGSGASHLITGHSAAHHALEEELAEFTQRPRALLFSTGYMANLGVICALTAPRNTVYEDRLNHASLVDAAVLSRARLRRYPHGDMSTLRNQLVRADKLALIVSDGVFSMDGDLAPVSALAELARDYNASLMIDDAHGLGVLGKTGRGILEHLAINPDDVPILMGTLGKAFGVFGAFVAGSEELIETLIQQARSYIYTTALPPALAEATRASLKLVQSEGWRREHLFSLITRFRSGATQLGLPLLPSATPIQPLIVGEGERALALSEKLYARGIVIRAIRPPTVPKGQARLRITFSAAHTEQHVDRLLETLVDVVAA